MAPLLDFKGYLKSLYHDDNVKKKLLPYKPSLNLAKVLFRDKLFFMISHINNLDSLFSSWLLVHGLVLGILRVFCFFGLYIGFHDNDA